MMKINIEVDGLVRRYEGNYDLLHNVDWNELMRDFIDTMHEHKKNL